MICFLTSRTDLPGSDDFRINPANGLLAELRRALPQPLRVLQICSDPESHERTDFYAKCLRDSLENAGLAVESFQVLDGRNEAEAPALIAGANLLILSGGHVPTQNRFFRTIGLRALLRDYDGVLVGISAGSMNCAELVYAQPEEPGEALDPAYQRFLPGLGLTKKMLLPHYQGIKDELLDGLRVMEDLAYPDSMGRAFYCLPDGSYLFIADGREEFRGEGYRLADGVLTPL